MGHTLKIDLKNLPQNRPPDFLYHKARKQVIDFLPQINPRVQADIDIMMSWVQYFYEINVPFKVMPDGKFLKLWKVRKIRRV